MQQARGDRILFSMADDNVMMDRILSTHSPDGHKFHVQPLFLIIEDVMDHANALLPGSILSTTLQGTQAQLDEKALNSSFSGILKLLAPTIKKISREISCKSSAEGDAQATTVSLFKTLSNYSWDVKVVVALAAFAVFYGEFWLVAQLYPTNPLANSVAHLKQLPNIMERAESSKPKFESLGKLIKAVLVLTKCIVKLTSLPSQYISSDNPEMVTATARIPIAVYWTIRSIVAFAFIIITLTDTSNEYIASTTEAWELYSLARKVDNIHTHLSKQLSLCQQQIALKKHDEAYRTFVRLLETPHFDNTKFLKTLIYPKDDQLPLFEGHTRRRVSIETLRNKLVLLLLTENDMSQEEIALFDSMYREAKQIPFGVSHYEVVWLPIMDRSVPWNEEKQKLLENTQNLMPWLFLYHPSMLDPLAIKYMKDNWHFTKKSIVVVVDPQGKVVNLNALHMMWIWGNFAYPFTSLREERLWEEESWRIDLLVDSIEPMIFQWISERKYICLYGGDDIDWIRRFTATAQAVARAANIHLEMLYVGKSNPTGKIRKINNIIDAENLSLVLPDLDLIWYFWSRIESMWHSKVQHGKSVENDEIMKEIMMLLYFDGCDQGWAVIFWGEKDMAKAKGEMFLESLSEFDKWKHDSEEKGFLPALNDYFKKLYTPHHCHRFTFPGSTGSVEDKMVCAECGRPMEKSTMYTCCTNKY
nr:PREDICTED: protein SIEVE ELEMENT OCCLUSION B-like isoform X1 [Daucus carota subsp. sativus]XP_017224200.1 PREDICTED: protein SIEVE ELEMENT OCCLUSION B-like isoform X1 [Daucus carota subsp. sativus]